MQTDADCGKMADRFNSHYSSENQLSSRINGVGVSHKRLHMGFQGAACYVEDTMARWHKKMSDYHLLWWYQVPELCPHQNTQFVLLSFFNFFSARKNHLVITKAFGLNGTVPV